MATGSAFDDWVPGDYLREYYNAMQKDEEHTIRFFVEQIREAPPGPVLCFGCGPTLHHIFLAAPRMTEVFLADYIPQNLQEIERWMRKDLGAHDWTPFVTYTLKCEAGVEPEAGQIEARMNLLRQKISGLLHADASLPDPLGEEFRGRFSAVLSPYCAEAATSEKAKWVQYARNIATLVKPGGLFLTSAVRCCNQYRAGKRFFPATSIDEMDLRDVLLQDFRAETVAVHVRKVPEHSNQGFSGILLARGSKA